MAKNVYLISDTWNLSESPSPRAICTTIKDFVRVMTELANEHARKTYMFYQVFVRESNMSDTVKKSNSNYWTFYRREFAQLQEINGAGIITEKSMRKFLKREKVI